MGWTASCDALRLAVPYLWLDQIGFGKGKRRKRLISNARKLPGNAYETQVRVTVPRRRTDFSSSACRIAYPRTLKRPVAST